MCGGGVRAGGGGEGVGEPLRAVTGTGPEAVEEGLERFGSREGFGTGGRGTQFAADAFRGCLQAAEARVLMDGMGCCMDNARTEQLQRPVKCEAVDWEEPGDGFASQEATPEWLRLCRRERPHAQLGDTTPQSALQRGGVARERLECGFRRRRVPSAGSR